MKKRKKIAFIHRYGLEGWICCGGHAISPLIETMSQEVDIHFFGPDTTELFQPDLRKKIHYHQLPYTWDRANPTDKITKTLLWYAWLPWIGIQCRIKGIHLIWNDETVPFTAAILRLFFGNQIAITVMDFFLRIYTQNHPLLQPLARTLEKIDIMTWRKLPLLFTKVNYTQTFLKEQGVPAHTLYLYRNPVDHTKFHPLDPSTRKTIRDQYGFTDYDIVLTHHGILHPNKGNDWILHQLAALKSQLPQLKFLLIGNGPEMDKLQNLTRKLDLADRVTFTGWLPSETDLNHALAAADIGLVMRIGQETDHYHMTDTLTHEMACAKPILAVNLQGIAEIIQDGINGYLFDLDQPHAFAHKLEQLTKDHTMRERFATNITKESQLLSASIQKDLLKKPFFDILQTV